MDWSELIKKKWITFDSSTRMNIAITTCSTVCRHIIKQQTYSNYLHTFLNIFTRCCHRTHLFSLKQFSLFSPKTFQPSFFVSFDAAFWVVVTQYFARLKTTLNDMRLHLHCKLYEGFSMEMTKWVWTCHLVWHRAFIGFSKWLRFDWNSMRMT